MSDSSSSRNHPPERYFTVSPPGERPDRSVGSSAFRKRLRGIRTDQDRNPTEKIQAILRLGADHFGVDNGHLTAIDPARGTHTIAAVSSPHPEIEPGVTSDLSRTFCRNVVAKDAALALDDAPAQGWADDPAFEQFALATYFGTKVIVSGKLYGTICFVSEGPREQPFTEQDARDLELIGWAMELQLEQRAQAERLDRTSARVEALFEEAPDMINIHDRAGNLIVPNPRLCEKTGYAEEELTAMKMWDLDQELDPDQARRIWNRMSPGDQRRWEGRYRRADGSSFPVEVDLRCLDPAGADRFVAISRDISDRKERERQLRTAKQEAEEASRLKSAFLANMSHEIRTPLASIIGFADLLAEETSGSSARYVELIRESGNRLLETLENVLELAQIESGASEPRPERVDLTDVVTRTAERLDEKAAERGIDFEIEVPDHEAPARIDPDLFERILTNLLGNAIKFTEDGRIRTVLGVTDAEIELEIADTGIGMKEEDVDRLLESFEQASTGLRRTYEGAGIGLTVVSRLTEMVGGTLSVDSAVGEGTVVRVRLPRWTGDNATGDGDRTEELESRRGPDDQDVYSTHRSK